MKTVSHLSTNFIFLHSHTFISHRSKRASNRALQERHLWVGARHRSWLLGWPRGRMAESTAAPWQNEDQPRHGQRPSTFPWYNNVFTHLFCCKELILQYSNTFNMRMQCLQKKKVFYWAIFSCMLKKRLVLKYCLGEPQPHSFDIPMMINLFKLNYLFVLFSVSLLLYL